MTTTTRTYNDNRLWKPIALALTGALGVVGLVHIATASGSGPDSGNRGIPYRGYLELNGSPVDGYVDMRVCVDTEGDCFADESGDRWVALYPNVPVYAGGFEVEIGPDGTTESSDVLPSWVFNSSEVYVQVEINGEALAGAQRIQPVPASYWTAEATDLDVSGQLRVEGASTFGGSATFQNTATFQGAVNFQGSNTFGGSSTFNDTVRIPGSSSLLVGNVNDDVSVRSNAIFFNNDTDDRVASSAGLEVDSEETLSLNGDAGLELTSGGDLNITSGFGDTLNLYGRGDAFIKGNGSQDTVWVRGDGVRLYGDVHLGDTETSGAAGARLRDGGAVTIYDDTFMVSQDITNTDGYVTDPDIEFIEGDCPSGYAPLMPRLTYCDANADNEATGGNDDACHVSVFWRTGGRGYAVKVGVESDGPRYYRLMMDCIRVPTLPGQPALGDIQPI